MKNDMFIKAFGIAETTNLNKEKRLEYEASLKAYRDLTVVLNESFDKGKVEGEVIGIEKGKIESLENSIITILETKFNSSISQEIIDTIKSYNDIKILNNILIKIININIIDEVEKILESPEGQKAKKKKNEKLAHEQQHSQSDPNDEPQRWCVLCHEKNRPRRKGNSQTVKQ